MSKLLCNLDQPIGFPIEQWQKRATPPQSEMLGNYCKVIPLDINKHAESLYKAYAKDKDHQNWTYLPYGPFNELSDFHHWLERSCVGDDPLFHTVIDLQTGQAIGMASYLRIEPAIGVIEVGHIHFSPFLQKTPMATEVMYLMMKRVFEELGYRRYEWKCDALNAPSRKAAVRLGFSFEGIFRQATMYKNRNRDTAWYSIVDTEWKRLKLSFEEWLNPANFNEQGQQLKSLSSMINPTPA